MMHHFIKSSYGWGLSQPLVVSEHISQTHHPGEKNHSDVQQVQLSAPPILERSNNIRNVA